MAILGVSFILMFAAFQGTAPLNDLQAHSSNAAAFVGQRLGGGSANRIMSLAVVFSVLATTQVAIIGTSRLIYAMSRDRVLPATLGTVNGRFQTPAFTTTALGVLMMALGVIDIFATSVANALNDRSPSGASSTQPSTPSPGSLRSGSTGRCSPNRSKTPYCSASSRSEAPDSSSGSPSKANSNSPPPNARYSAELQSSASSC